VDREPIAMTSSTITTSNEGSNMKYVGTIGKITFSATTRKWNSHWDWVITSKDEVIDDLSYPHFFHTPEEAYENLGEWLSSIGAKYTEVMS
jgi:hypothetical protein